MDRQDWRSLADEYGPGILLGVVVAYMFWVRTLDADSVIKDSVVYFTGGNDPWYHARIVHLIVEHFPATQRFDPFSYFPYGTGRHSGFGGLFDQLIALAAVVAGFGSPSDRLVDIVIALAPAAFGALTAIPVYLVSRRIYDRLTGLVAAGFLALFGGGFLFRTTIGVADHQSSEAFFATFATLGFLLAVTTAYREKPMLADIRDRNWIVLRRPVVASILGGVGIGAYLMTWGPGVFFVFTMGLFVVLQSFRDHLRGRPLEYLVFGTVGSMTTAGVFTLLYAKSYGLTSTAFSLLQPLVCFGIAAGAIVLYGLSTYAERESYDDWYYPLAALALIFGSFALATLVYPRTFDLFMGLVSRIYSFGLLKSATALTVAELSPGSIQSLWQAYGPILFLSAWALPLLFARVIRRDRPGELLLLLWTLTMVSAYFSMTRFSYYIAINAAILGALAVAWTVRRGLEFDAVDSLSDVEPYQVMGILVILIMIVPGNVVAFGGMFPAYETAEYLSGADTSWQKELDWMQENTPELPMEYNERYMRPADGDFDYPEGAYGVMSWWDYGHWITKNAHRAAFANPFQQGPRRASAFLQFQNETRANLFLDALPSLESMNVSPYQISTERLRSIVQSQSDQKSKENIRYVVIDDQMAALDGYRSSLRSPKFGAITKWTGPGTGSYISNKEVTLRQVRNGQFARTNRTARVPAVNDAFADTMISELYFQDANGLAHYRLVHETNTTARFTSIAVGSEQRGYRVAQINSFLTNTGLRILRRPNAYAYNVRLESRVKTFERVEGATLTGQMDISRPNVTTNTTVIARLGLQTNKNRNFTYTHRTTLNDDGSFSLTVPYPTNDAVSVAEGGTDSGVHALGNYTIQVGGNLLRFRGQVIPIGAQATGTATVPESAIYEGETIRVDVQRIQQNTSTGQSGGNQSSLVQIPNPNPSDLSAPDTTTPPSLVTTGAEALD